jgi:hypothetical protein
VIAVDTQEYRPARGLLRFLEAIGVEDVDAGEAEPPQEPLPAELPGRVVEDPVPRLVQVPVKGSGQMQAGGRQSVEIGEDVSRRFKSLGGEHILVGDHPQIEPLVGLRELIMGVAMPLGGDDEDHFRSGDRAAAS